LQPVPHVAKVPSSGKAGVSLFAAGTEPENTASVRCLLSAGFQPLDPAGDWEGIVYDARRRA
jgi:hypothetical protein